MMVSVGVVIRMTIVIVMAVAVMGMALLLRLDAVLLFLNRAVLMIRLVSRRIALHTGLRPRMMIRGVMHAQ